MRRLDKAISHHDKMTKTPVEKLIISLGIPTTVSMLITNVYNLADTYFVGALGESQQAATGVLFTLQCIIQAFSFLLGHGSGAYVSKSLADNDTKQAGKYASTAFFTGITLGTLVMVSGLAFLTPFVKLLGSTDTILPYARDYGMWVLLACPFMVGSFVVNNILRFEGKAFYAMIGLTTGGVLNIFGDYLLVYLLGMGVYGAGLATALSQVISFTLLVIFHSRMAQSKISPKNVSFEKSIHLDIIKCGMPSLIRQGLTAISGGMLNNFTKVYGDAAIAAMSVVNRFSSFVMCVGLGIGQGFQPVAAFNYRVKRFDRVKRGLLFTMLFGFLFIGVLSAIGFALAPNIIEVFQKSPAVIEIGTPALRYACIGLLFMAVSVPVNMLYQSIRMSGIASFLSTLRTGLVFIPTLVIAATFFGLDGIRISQPLSDVISGIICIPFIVWFLKKDHSESSHN